MNKWSKTGKLLALISGGLFVFSVVLMINDDGSTLTALAIPFMFLSLLVMIAAILFIKDLSKEAFHINNFIVLFMLMTFNALALFGAEFSGGADSAMYITTGLSFVIWGVFYFLQFVRSHKAWRTTLFLIMVVFLFFWETGLGYLFGQMIS